jgi:acyl carrier protein
MDRALRDEIKELLIRALDLRGRTAAEIEDDAPLFGAGLGLDSLDALELAVAIEDRFGVAVPDGDEGRRVFASIAALAEHVQAHRAVE